MQLSKALARSTVLSAEEISQLPVDQGFRRQQERYSALAAMPVPEQWQEGAIWRFQIAPMTGESPRVVEFEITGELAKTCVSGDWHALAVVGSTTIGTHKPAYSVQGRNLHILLSTALCDAYDEISGEFDSVGFKGWRQSSGMFGTSRTGRVTGRARAGPDGGK